jgi:small-conductance mechanosensitive channel
MRTSFARLCNVFLILLCCLALMCPFVQETTAAVPDSAGVITSSRLSREAPVVLWNRTIVVFRAYYEELSPQDRAKFAVERMNLVPANLPEYRVSAVDVLENGHPVAMIKVNGRFMFALVEGDVDLARGETYDSSKQHTVQAVSGWLMARKSQYMIPLLLRALGMALTATIVASVVTVGVTKLMRLLLNYLKRKESGASHRFVIAGVNAAPYLLSLVTGLVRIVEGVMTISIAYLWLAFVLSLFPYTEPWAWELSGFLSGLMEDFGHGILSSIPGIFTVCVIFFITRLVVSVITMFFRAVEEEVITPRWFDSETARATRRIVVVLVWVFALVIAYPMIPGSQTKAFQGVSVFLGLMLSLGSAGLVGQLIGGIVAVYTKAFQAGDYVRIGEHEGVVKELGLLAAKIVTIRKEEVTIPNALLMASTTINFTRQSDEDGAIVATGVTIGYDAPWRQVHAMLLMAAEKTDGIRQSPKPFVLQSALSDFYVEYTLMSRIDRPEDRYYILSKLHAHIQDVFNEFGVQIMSPNFVMQPRKDVGVPKEQWYAAPATGDRSSPSASD